MCECVRMCVCVWWCGNDCCISGTVTWYVSVMSVTPPPPPSDGFSSPSPSHNISSSSSSWWLNKWEEERGGKLLCRKEGEHMKTILLMVQREIVFIKGGSAKREWERVDTCPNSLFSFPLTYRTSIIWIEISPSHHTSPL